MLNKSSFLVTQIQVTRTFLVTLKNTYWWLRKPLNCFTLSLTENFSSEVSVRMKACTINALGNLRPRTLKCGSSCLGTGRQVSVRVLPHRVKHRLQFLQIKSRVRNYNRRLLEAMLFTGVQESATFLGEAAPAKVDMSRLAGSRRPTPVTPLRWRGGRAEACSFTMMVSRLVSRVPPPHPHFGSEGRRAGFADGPMSNLYIPL